MSYNENYCLITYEFFRPNYKVIAKFYREKLHGLPVSFFTATSTSWLRQKIQRDFSIEDIVIVISKFKIYYIAILF